MSYLGEEVREWEITEPSIIPEREDDTETYTPERESDVPVPEKEEIEV